MMGFPGFCHAHLPPRPGGGRRGDSQSLAHLGSGCLLRESEVTFRPLGFAGLCPNCSRCPLPPISSQPPAFVAEGNSGSLFHPNPELCAEQRPALASQDGVTWKHGTHRPPLATAGSPFIETSLFLAEGQIGPFPQKRTSSWESSLFWRQSVVRKTK